MNLLIETSLVKTKSLHDGYQQVYKFPNGYGASVIRHTFSYGGDLGLKEIAVLNKDGNITYDTPITDDVVGFLSDEDVESYLIRISELPND